ncbi:peptidoglycan binding protein CsiV [Aestuariibacter halophilus]|uniref:Peptidoglycan binding protein CsiV n=1 Tax=Fluctibacter halophilus TaxID=226011 RepID=A0ABS8G5V4_9ALTE|nr:CsiV family protein [Aestuariibacter halophilus]MCC2615878.1 peptidoglycan binding protein CsiV [Aestuariibacter halophilus]
MMHRLFTPILKRPASWVAGALLLSPFVSVQAQQKEWWFDVEVLVFERTLNPNDIQEQFPDAVTTVSVDGLRDLLKDYLVPDIHPVLRTLPTCDSTEEALIWPAISLPDLWQPALDEPNADLPSNREPDEVVATDALIERLNTTDATGQHRDGIIVGGPQVAMSLAQWTEQVSQTYPKASTTDSSLSVPTLRDKLGCLEENERWQWPPLNPQPSPLTDVPSVPTVIDGLEWPHLRRDSLLSATSLNFAKLRRDIDRRNGMRSLLHLGWRQEVQFGQQNATTYRLYGGINYAQQYAPDGQSRAVLLSPTDIEPTQDNPSLSGPSLVEQIRQQLQSPWLTLQLPAKQHTDSTEDLSPVAPLWQLDGAFQVFLRNINGVPYLHINSEMDYRLPVFEADTDALSIAPPTRLKTFPFQQLRRIISTQVHYFDHPLFGMVVQLRRYTPPPLDEEMEDTQ